MNSRSALRILAWVPALALTALAQPQSERSAAFDVLSRDSSEWYVPKSTISFGLRVLSSGAQVQFGNLGNIPLSLAIAPAADGEVDRVYHNGRAMQDSPRANEVDADGNQTSTPGGRYLIQVYNNDGTQIDNGDGTFTDAGDGTFTTVGDELSYTPGLTRSWGYQSDSQLSTPGFVALSGYSATSGGGVASHDQGPTGGIDVQLARALNKPGGRLQWSLVAGVALSDINAKANGTVASTLQARTDFYPLNGQVAPPAPYSAPSFGQTLDADGNVAGSDGIETTTPLVAVPAFSANTSLAGGAAVQGNWQIKGAYFLFKLGPAVRTQLWSRLGLSASAGVAGAYSGSRYSVVESMTLPDVADPISVTEESIESKFLSGFYADVSLDWMINERTGFFGGVTMQQLGDYDQSAGGRTARIDLGNTVGLRGGINIRF